MPEEIKIKDQLTELTEKVRDIHTYIGGNEMFGQKGVKHTLVEHGDRIDKLEKSDAKKWMKAGVVGGGLGGMLGILFPKTWIAKLIAWIPF